LNRASYPGDVHDRIAVRLSTLNQSPRRYFINQLYELLTEFGPVHDICFDGANYATSASTRPLTTRCGTTWRDPVARVAPPSSTRLSGRTATSVDASLAHAYASNLRFTR
jgi:hypothetical protein